MFKKIYRKTKSIYDQAIFPYTHAGLKKRVLFIHIPKSAGTAIRLALGEPEVGRRHLPWWVYEQASPKRFKKLYKFAFVRNPVERALSGYHYLKSGGNQKGDLSVSEYLKKYNSFSDFLEYELLEGSMIYHPIFRPQSWYICDWNGDIKVDYVGRIETINMDFENIVKESKMKNINELPVVNESTKDNEVVGDSSKKIIYEVYKSDFEIFGY